MHMSARESAHTRTHTQGSIIVISDLHGFNAHKFCMFNDFLIDEA